MFDTLIEYLKEKSNGEFGISLEASGAQPVFVFKLWLRCKRTKRLWKLKPQSLLPSELHKLPSITWQTLEMMTQEFGTRENVTTTTADANQYVHKPPIVVEIENWRRLPQEEADEYWDDMNEPN